MNGQKHFHKFSYHARLVTIVDPLDITLVEAITFGQLFSEFRDTFIWLARCHSNHVLVLIEVERDESQSF